MCAVYAFMCLAAWYVCRAIPIDGRTMLRLASTLGTASVVATVLWLVAAQVWVSALSTLPGFAGLTHFDGLLTVLFPSGILLFLLAAALHYLLLMLEESRQSERRALELQVLAREAELKALRAQIDPHFLFNSLNSISALAMRDPAGARRMCLLLAEFLRSSLRLGAHERITFGDEMKLADNFLDIEKVRFGERIIVERQIDPDCSECLVPPLLIQPLIENAVRHGIAPLVDGGALRIHAERRGGNLRVMLENPFDSESSSSGAGVGLKNVRDRLNTIFDGDARIEIERIDGRFKVFLDMPCEHSNARS